jgi:hypothetical protein
LKTALTQEDEDTLQALAHELEIVAESLRCRAWRGRDAGSLGDVVRDLETLVRRVAVVVPAPSATAKKS